VLPSVSEMATDGRGERLGIFSDIKVPAHSAHISDNLSLNSPRPSRAVQVYYSAQPGR
jgi:hypothetical protein